MSVYNENLTQAFADVPLELRGIYHTQLEPNQIYRGHGDVPLEQCGLLVALTGTAMFNFNRSLRQRLEPGKAFVGGYGATLEIEVGANGFEYFLIHYVPRDFHQSGAEQLIKVNILPCPLQPLLRKQMDEAMAPGPIGIIDKTIFFYSLVGYMLRKERDEQDKESQQFVNETIQYMHTHFASSITLTELASRYDMKTKYFSHLFQKYNGLTPINYLIQLRMQKACEMLLTGQYTVEQVAQNVGYADPYYFSRLFKKYIGSSPSKFR